MRRSRCQFGDDAGGVLVGEHTEHQAPFVEVEAVVQSLRECLGAVRVVSRVDDHGRGDAEQLQPAR